MTRYTFAELLTVFYHLHQDLETYKTQAELAQALGVSRRTVAGWFAGDYLPRSAEHVERLAHLLCLTAFQADLLFYAANPAWLKYGTPPALLESAEVMRYREVNAPVQHSPLHAVPSLAEIERTWRVVFADSFESNYRRWGVGVKENGMCRLERSMRDRCYVLALQNQYHEDVFMSGDSACLAPEIYYLTVNARMAQGQSDADGYGLMFEAISDECYAIFRVREQMGKVSVVRTFDGGDHAMVYLRQVTASSIRPGELNKLAILVVHQEHWFYINDTIIGHAVIPRLPCARLDVGVAAGSQQQVIAHFGDFRVSGPPGYRLYSSLERLMGMTLEI